MLAQRFLSRAKWLEKRIESKLDQIEKLNSMATNITSVITDMPHNPSPNQDKLGTAVAGLIDLQNLIENEIKEYLETIKDVSTMISRLPAKQQYVLSEYYLNGKSMEQIADSLDCTRQNVWLIYRQGLAEVEKILSKNAEMDKLKET